MIRLLVIGFCVRLRIEFNGLNYNNMHIKRIRIANLSKDLQGKPDLGSYAKKPVEIPSPWENFRKKAIRWIAIFLFLLLCLYGIGMDGLLKLFF